MTVSDSRHTGEGWGRDIPQPRLVRIVRVDYALNELYDAEGNGYYEMPGSIWMQFGPVHEGSIRYWGSGSHAGHINLLPAAQFIGGEWVGVMSSKRKGKL